MKEYLSVSTIFDFAACLLYPCIAEDTRTQSTTAQVFPQYNPILSHSISSPSIHNPHTPTLNLLNLQPPTLLTHNPLLPLSNLTIKKMILITRRSVSEPTLPPSQILIPPHPPLWQPISIHRRRRRLDLVPRSRGLTSRTTFVAKDIAIIFVRIRVRWR